MAKRIVLGVHVTNRVQNVPELQQVLSEYGCNIRTRLGLHEVSEAVCAPTGLLILDTFGEEAEIVQMEKKLREVKGLGVQKMEFDY